MVIVSVNNGFETESKTLMKDSKGRFTKGNPGRPKGSKNKVNSQLKDLLNKLREKVFTLDQLEADLMEVKPEVRLAFFQNTLEFDLPKLSRQELEHDLSNLDTPVSPWDDEVKE